MQHGVIAARAESKAMDHRSDAKFIGTEHKPYRNGDEPVESSFGENVGTVIRKMTRETTLK